MDSNLLRIRHERSKKDFPKLNLEDDEFVELAFSRAKNSLIFAWAKVGAIAVIVLLVLLLLMVSEIVADENGIGFFLILTLALALTLVGTVLAVTAVHYGNKLFFTNKRVIQIVVNMPFLENERIVNLGAVQEVTYAQNSIVEKMMNFGTLKLSTHEKNIMVLDNDTPQSALNIINDNSGNVYTFKDVAITQQQIDEVNELISKAPKLDHKIVEEESGMNVDLVDDLEGKDDVAAFNEKQEEQAETQGKKSQALDDKTEAQEEKAVAQREEAAGQEEKAAVQGEKAKAPKVPKAAIKAVDDDATGDSDEDYDYEL